MYGKLLFIGTGAFALGILFGISSRISWDYLGLSIFFGILCLVFALSSSISRARTFLFVCALFLLFMPAGEVRSAFAPNALPSNYLSLINTSVSLEGTIVADPDIREKNQQLLVSVNRNGEKTNILVFAPLFQHFVYGERILIAGKLTKPAPFTTDDGRIFRYDQYLAKKGVFSLVEHADILEVSPPSGMWDQVATILFQIKHTFVQGLSHALSAPYDELATGLLTGDQHSLSDALVTTLALSGLIWVVVLSGYHVTLIAEAVLKLFSFLPRRIAFIFAGLSVLAIIFATGASAPSLRGGLMACFTLFARSTNRTYDALRALCVTMIIILLWNPLLLAYDSGFQLSVVVTPALILGTPILERWLLSSVRITNSFVREVIAVSVVAQLACLPLILWQTGQLSPWAIPANMLVMSLVPVAMLFSTVAGFVGMLFPLLAPLAGLPAYAVLYYILTVAKISANLPFAGTVLPSFPFIFVPVLYGVFILILYRMHVRQKVTEAGAAKAASAFSTSLHKSIRTRERPKPLRSKNAFQ